MLTPEIFAGFLAGAKATFERLCATVVVAALTVPAFVWLELVNFFLPQMADKLSI